MASVDPPEDLAGSESAAKQDTFERVIERLQAIVTQLEEGDLPLERSLEVFEEGVRLSRLGERQLDEAERRVDLLLRDANGAVATAGGEPSLRPLEEKELDRS